MLTLVAVSGCGEPLIVPVKGRVTCNGKPVEAATLTFSPLGSSPDVKEPGRPATGFTDAGGNFELSTNKEFDGALVGQHSVNIMLDDTNPARCPRQTNLTLEVKPEDNEFKFELSK
jgi:hypothetical protein